MTYNIVMILEILSGLFRSSNSEMMSLLHQNMFLISYDTQQHSRPPTFQSLEECDEIIPETPPCELEILDDLELNDACSDCATRGSDDLVTWESDDSEDETSE